MFCFGCSAARRWGSSTFGPRALSATLPLSLRQQKSKSHRAMSHISRARSGHRLSRNSSRSRQTKAEVERKLTGGRSARNSPAMKISQTPGTAVRSMLNGRPGIARHSCATSWPRTSPSSIAITGRNGKLLPKRSGGSKNSGSELSGHSDYTLTS